MNEAEFLLYYTMARSMLVPSKDMPTNYCMEADDDMEPATLRLVKTENGKPLLLCSPDMAEVAMGALSSQRAMDALLNRFGMNTETGK